MRSSGYFGPYGSQCNKFLWLSDLNKVRCLKTVHCTENTSPVGLLIIQTICYRNKLLVFKHLEFFLPAKRQINFSVLFILSECSWINSNQIFGFGKIRSERSAIEISCSFLNILNFSYLSFRLWHLSLIITFCECVPYHSSWVAWSWFSRVAFNWQLRIP